MLLHLYQRGRWQVHDPTSMIDWRGLSIENVYQPFSFPFQEAQELESRLAAAQAASKEANQRNKERTKAAAAARAAKRAAKAAKRRAEKAAKERAEDPKVKSNRLLN